MLPNCTRPTISTFVKTASHQTVEILGLSGLDYIVIDAEHAPFDLATLDTMLLAARAAGLPTLVRISDHRSARIGAVLDMGADGIVVPHVDSAAEAAELVAAARYLGGGRGLSGSTRAGGYGTVRRGELIAQGDGCLIVCQIESAAAVGAVEDIASVAGVGGLFIGRADLALSFGLSDTKAAAVLTAVARTTAAARARGVASILAVEQDVDVAAFRALGIDSFVYGSDQSLLRKSAALLSALLE